MKSSCDGVDYNNVIFFYRSIDLMREEGGGSVELISGGREIQVTSQNLFEYIRRYTEYRLIKAQEKALEVIKQLLIYCKHKFMMINKLYRH